MGWVIDGLFSSSPGVCQAQVRFRRRLLEHFERDRPDDGYHKQCESDLADAPQRRGSAGVKKSLRGKIPENPG
jgi:hypothetical protein